MAAYEAHAILKQCKGCGRTFLTHYYDKVYHSAQCKDNASKKRQRMRSKSDPTDTQPERDWHAGALAVDQHINDPRYVREREALAKFAHLPHAERIEKEAEYLKQNSMNSDEAQSVLQQLGYSRPVEYVPEPAAEPATPPDDTKPARRGYTMQPLDPRADEKPSEDNVGKLAVVGPTGDR